MVESLRKDLVYAGRSLRRSPGFSAVAVLSLGLGVGVNTAMFSLVDALLFRPIPVQDPGTLVDLFSTDGDEYATSSYADYADVKAQNTVFSDMTAYSPMMAPLALGDRSRVALGQIVTGNHFTMFGIQPQLGRLLTPADDVPGAERVVVLSDRMWRREYGADAGIVGRTITLRGLVYTVAGVAPAAFTGVVPAAHARALGADGARRGDRPDRHHQQRPRPRTHPARTAWRAVDVHQGAAEDGVTPAQAHANVALIGEQLATAYPQTNKDSRIAAVPSADVRLLVPQAGGVLSVGAAGVMAIVGLVLLIACANVAGMLLARASARRREISVRLAVGASRGRLVQQLLVEGLVLGVIGAATAIACAWALIRALLAIELPLPVEVALDLRLDARVLSFTLAIAAVTGLLASLLPALKASTPDVVGDLRGEAPAARVGGRRWALRDGLVVAQVALTAVLLVVAGLLLRSLGASRQADVGFNPRGLAAVAFDTDMMRYEPERGAEFLAYRAGAYRRAARGHLGGHRHADVAVHLQLQPAGDEDRQPHLRRGPARRDHRKRRRVARLPRHARHPPGRRARCRPGRHRRRAGRGDCQRDHGAALLAAGVGPRAHGDDCEHRPHLPRRRRERRSQAARCARAPGAVCLLRVGAAPEPLQFPGRPHPG